MNNSLFAGQDVNLYFILPVLIFPLKKNHLLKGAGNFFAAAAGQLGGMGLLSELAQTIRLIQ